MELIQNIYYITGSLMNIVIMTVFIMIGIFAYLAYKKISETQQKIRSSIQDMKENVGDKVMGFVKSNPSEIASIVGTGLASFVMNKIKGKFKK